MSGAVIYCRVSTKDQVDNFSLGTQERACREYCERNGLKVFKVFVEEGESAKSVNRARFKDMLAYCREKKGVVSHVIVYNTSRFARNANDHFATRAYLAKLGVSFRSVTEAFDESSQGKFVEGIMAIFAQFDNDLRAERTVTGMKAAVAEGRFPFKAPLGFLNSRAEVGPSLVIDPERGPLVRHAFELFATGLHTTQHVLETVTAAGLRTIRDKPVSKQTFGQLLRKPVYAGWISVDGWGKPTRGDFETLISQEVFDKVQFILDGKGPIAMPRVKNNPDFPLRHFVRCGCCGKPLTASWSKGRNHRYPYYHCANAICRKLTVKKTVMETEFAAFLRHLQPKQTYVKLMREIVLDAWREREARNLTLTASLNARMDGLHRKQEQLEAKFVFQEAIDKATYMRLKEKVTEEILLAEMQLNDAKLDAYDIEAVLAFAETLILNAERLWIEASPEQKERLQKVYFPKGVIFDGKSFGTTEAALFFCVETHSATQESRMATLSGIEPEPLP